MLYLSADKSTATYNLLNLGIPNIVTSPEATKKSSLADSLSQQLDLALSVYVFNRMPIRLLDLSTKTLLERDEVIEHIKCKMSGIGDACLTMMREKVEELSRMKLTDSETGFDDPGEEDVREDPVRAICDFLVSEYGSYAILSHTWVGTELRYQDTLVTNWQTTTTKQAGYEKISGFCNVAQEYGFSLGWMDTICINKDSSAELDESIRSMYQWYRDASICVTYLRHTTVDSNAESADELPRDVLDSMATDRWFTRGWTLQELLAPKQIKFYDKNWKKIHQCKNDKENPEIQKVITKVTTIQQEDIESFDPLQTHSSIIERMIWATKRQTTRGEDRAYSLMGVFGVQLSIAYGEGAESAFFRLVEKIITSRGTSEIIQVLTWGGKPISDSIHPSRLLPSCPECYLYLPQTVENFKGALPLLTGDCSPRAISLTCKTFPGAREPMTLTHLGLKLRLLLIKTTMSSVESVGTGRSGQGKAHEDIGPFEVTLWCHLLTSDEQSPSRFTQKIRTNIGLHKKHSYRPNSFDAICESKGPHVFFIGIYTFKEDEEIVMIPPWYCAVLLGIPIVNEQFSMRDLSADSFEPNSKISTCTTLHLDNYKHSEVVRINKLEHADVMKVMTVNL